MTNPPKILWALIRQSFVLYGNSVLHVSPMLTHTVMEYICIVIIYMIGNIEYWTSLFICIYLTSTLSYEYTKYLLYTERTKVLSAVQDALQLLVEKRPNDPLLFLSEQYPLYHSL